jgi:uncharacterized protein (TIGR03435 family)
MRSETFAGLFVMCVWSASPAFPQSAAPAATPPAFEVASVKLSGPRDFGVGMLTYSGGRIVITQFTLKMLIQHAYGLHSFQVSGGPKWADETPYYVTAKPPDSSPSSKYKTRNPKLPAPEEELLMLRTLLAERFKLKVHEEAKEGRVYELTLAGQGHKMTPAKNPDDFPVVTWGVTGKPNRPNFMRAYNASMELFATKRLTDELRLPVIDQTGLTGSFDFFFEYAHSPETAPEAPTIFNALQDLGLKLAATRGPVRHLVIDQAEPASEN